jgi:hypothetical protein
MRHNITEREMCLWYNSKIILKLKFFSVFLSFVIIVLSFQIVDNHIKQKHHALRVNGYLEFYQHTHQHSRIPFYIVSLCK